MNPRKLNDEQVAYAQELFDNNWHLEDIAKELGCTSMTIRNRIDTSTRPRYHRTGKRVLHNHILTMRW